MSGYAYIVVMGLGTLTIGTHVGTDLSRPRWTRDTLRGCDNPIWYNNVDTSPVGTDLSRPFWRSSAQKDVINRSLQISTLSCSFT